MPVVSATARATVAADRAHPRICSPRTENCQLAAPTSASRTDAASASAQTGRWWTCSGAAGAATASGSSAAGSGSAGASEFSLATAASIAVAVSCGRRCSSLMASAAARSAAIRPIRPLPWCTSASTPPSVQASEEIANPINARASSGLSVRNTQVPASLGHTSAVVGRPGSSQSEGSPTNTIRGISSGARLLTRRRYPKASEPSSWASSTIITHRRSDAPAAVMTSNSASTSLAAKSASGLTSNWQARARRSILPLSPGPSRSTCTERSRSSACRADANVVLPDPGGPVRASGDSPRARLSIIPVTMSCRTVAMNGDTAALAHSDEQLIASSVNSPDSAVII